MGYLGRLPVEIRLMVYAYVGTFHSERCTVYEFVNEWAKVKDAEDATPDITNLARTCRQAYQECTSTFLSAPSTILSFPRLPEHSVEIRTDRNPMWSPNWGRYPQHPYSKLWDADPDNPASFLPANLASVTRIHINIDLSWLFEYSVLLQNLMKRLQLGKNLTECSISFENFAARSFERTSNPVFHMNTRPGLWWHFLLCPCKIEVRPMNADGGLRLFVNELRDLEELRYHNNRHPEDHVPDDEDNEDRNDIDIHSTEGLRRRLLVDPTYGLFPPKQ
ncbi:hypothetical protein K461DRAFT_295721 [Myriangium duriaei CBS 260.36]|uniref:Uncharacterized protein n=1 Tax=Myriangium duriaei CBS 260.36 TaxID=1168546 RepID=A0A9P4J127_9PEZI|nr:hypothetical protein K461DRAFT_295721 [Myriangium duriaei CBS 260.36]